MTIEFVFSLTTFFFKRDWIVDFGRNACTCIIKCLSTGVCNSLQKFLLKNRDFVEHTFGHLKNNHLNFHVWLCVLYWTYMFMYMYTESKTLPFVSVWYDLICTNKCYQKLKMLSLKSFPSTSTLISFSLPSLHKFTSALKI